MADSSLFLSFQKCPDTECFRLRCELGTLHRQESQSLQLHFRVWAKTFLQVREPFLSPSSSSLLWREGDPGLRSLSLARVQTSLHVVWCHLAAALGATASLSQPILRGSSQMWGREW